MRGSGGNKTFMYKYRVAFLVDGKQFNAWFTSPLKYCDEVTTRKMFRETAVKAANTYINEARQVPKQGIATDFAIWPENIPTNLPIQPLDAFEK